MFVSAIPGGAQGLLPLALHAGNQTQVRCRQGRPHRHAITPLTPTLFSRLFEMGFAEQLQEIIGRLPGGHQTVLFSATLPKLLVEFARAGECLGGQRWGGWWRGTWRAASKSQAPPDHHRPHGARAHPAGCGHQTQRAAQGEAHQALPLLRTAVTRPLPIATLTDPLSVPTDIFLPGARGHQGCCAPALATWCGAAPGPDRGVCGH